MKTIGWILAASLISGGVLLAQPGRGPLRECVEELNLTDAQQTQIEKLRLEHEKKVVQQRARLQEARIEMRSQMRSEKPERAALEKAARAMTDARSQMEMARLDHWLEVRALLTPEQQKLWKDLPGRPRRGEMRGGRHGDDGPRRLHRGRRCN